MTRPLNCSTHVTVATGRMSGWPPGPGNAMGKTLVEKFRSDLRSLASNAASYQSEPLSRLEMWLGVITVYLVLSAFLMGQFSDHTGAAQKQSAVPVSNRA
jgi:hypothetical protein